MLPGASPIKAALSSAAFLFVVLSGCSTADSFRGTREIAAWAEQRGFSEAFVQAGKFRIAAFVRKPTTSHDTLTIYIEGDGAAWPTPYHPPRDPTPTRPVSLALAVADPSAAVAYLGRPCQYLSTEALRGCESAYWTERRFAPEVLAAYEVAISQLKLTTGARRLKLFGYSGGGVLAALLAAQRNDVELLVTVAAPLAVTEWVTWHKISPLTGSLDPVELSENARLPRSVHFVGAKDEIVPAAVVEYFSRRKGGRMEVISGFDHECCWARDWAVLLGRVKFQETEK